MCFIANGHRGRCAFNAGVGRGHLLCLLWHLRVVLLRRLIMLELGRGVFRSLVATAVESRLLLGHRRGVTTAVSSSALRLLTVGLWLRLCLLVREEAGGTLLAVATGGNALRLLLLMRLLVLLHLLLLWCLAIATHSALLTVRIETVTTAAILMLRLLLMLRCLVMELRLLLLLRIAALLRLVVAALLRLLLLLLLARESTVSAATATAHSVLGLVATGTTHVVLRLLVLWLATVTGAAVLIATHVRGLLLLLLLQPRLRSLIEAQRRGRRRSDVRCSRWDHRRRRRNARRRHCWRRRGGRAGRHEGRRVRVVVSRVGEGRIGTSCSSTSSSSGGGSRRRHGSSRRHARRLRRGRSHHVSSGRAASCWRSTRHSADPIARIVRL